MFGEEIQAKELRLFLTGFTIRQRFMLGIYTICQSLIVGFHNVPVKTETRTSFPGKHSRNPLPQIALLQEDFHLPLIKCLNPSEY